MSRHHQVTFEGRSVTREEINRQSRLQEQRIRAARTDAINAATRTAKEAIERAKAETNRRLEKEIGDLERRTNSRIAELDRRHSENLKRATNHIYDDMKRGFDNMSRAIEAEAEYLNGRINNVKQWTQRNLDIINKNICQMQQETNSRFKQQQQQIDSLQESVHDIFDRFKNEATIAHDVVNEMNQLLQVVCENNPVDKYAPEELREIHSHINDLISRNDPAASIVAESRIITRDILKMKEKTVFEKAKHDQLLFQTKARLAAILEVIGKNINIEVKHEGETAAIATDFWTDGQYSEVQEKLKEIEKQLANEENNNELSSTQIEELFKEVERLNLQGVALMQQAIDRAMLSQDRAETTLDIVNAMIQQGYIIKNENGEGAFGYLGGEIASDQREGVFAILQHPITGEEVTIIISPDHMDVHLDNLHQPVTQQQLRESVNRIMQEMRASGHKIRETDVPEDGSYEANPQMQSGQQMREAGASERLRSH